jgi:large subunit ribosomal protein L15
MPLKRRVPKRGFTNIFRIEYRTVNVDRLNELPAGSEVTPEFLQKLGLLRKGKSPVKVLGNGELTIALTVHAHKYTGSAVQKIEAAGGRAEVIS